jgi:tripartite-type tricarboxylate transporter receptor subunit TctC
MNTKMKRLMTLGLFVLVISLSLACTNSEVATTPSDENDKSVNGGAESVNSDDKSEENVSEGADIDYPNSQIRLIIPYSPGGGTDVIFRIFASYAEKELGTTIVPVNMPGANATIGAREVKNADPDGYTILGHNDVLSIAKLTGMTDYSFDAFEPVSLLTVTPNMAIIHSQYGWTDIKEFVDYVKNNPGEVKWGATPGSTSHIFMQMMMNEAGIESDEMKMIGYEGTGEAIRAIQAGEIHGTMGNVPSSLGFLEDGTFVSLGLAHRERLSGVPDISTFHEQDLDMIHATNRGVFAPKGTPDEILQKIEHAFRKASENPELQRKIEDVGSIVDYIPRDEYKIFLGDTEERLKKVMENMDF